MEKKGSSIYQESIQIIRSIAAGCKTRCLRCRPKMFSTWSKPRLRAFLACRLGLGLFARPHNEPIIRINSYFFLVFVIAVLLFCSGLHGRPTTADEAVLVVEGWLKVNNRPLGTTLGVGVRDVETFVDDNGSPVYYVVYPENGGFVVVSADDSVEPIIAFADEGIFESSAGNPLGALVNRDVKGRVESVRNTISLQTGSSVGPRSKWRNFIDIAESSGDGIALLAVNSVSDVRVEPLVKSKWGQTTKCDELCFNYYTPENYPCGCTATAMAQLMRYHEYPSGRGSNVGRKQFEIKVDDVEEYAYTRGGDGRGGPYRWSIMVLEPDCGTSLEQREAIGALCYDASVAAKTQFASEGSASSLRDARTALLGTFMYGNAVYARAGDGIIERAALNEMVNSNLDAGYPVILGIIKEDTEVGHAVVADGYGYDFSALYHHINMGWNGIDDVWYNLPDVDYAGPGYYDAISGCIYNIYTDGSGEIISGRVTDVSGQPVVGAIVAAHGWGGPYTTQTNERGIYALVKVNANTTYTLDVIKPGFVFTTGQVTTGRSGDVQNVSGNKWGIDFTEDDAPADYSSDDSTEDFETADFSKYPWINAGDGRWGITFLERYSGTYCAETGKIEGNQSADLQVSIECASGDITFYYKVSSEASYDYLKFYIDGVEKAGWSGVKDWDKASFPVEAGERTFEWTYSKDGSLSRGSDTAWIDEIVFPLNYEASSDSDSNVEVEKIFIEDRLAD
ncbi:MAG: C10 family peptidase [Sedimentisphaerales bacterium]|nr:C10 family peptidase [Sedimentisphaerales bacterium]